MTGVVLFSLSSFSSCTYDYFLDETNLKVQVAEVLSPTDAVQNVFVVVLDENDSYQASVFVTHPFTSAGSTNALSSTKSAYNSTTGIMSFKVPQYGSSVYKLACFANIDPDSYSKSSSPYTIWLPVSDSDTLRNSMQNLRTAFREVMPPVGSSITEEFKFTEGGELLDSLDYRARITCRFKQVPTQNINRVKVRFKSSTDMYYSGEYALGLSGDYSGYHWIEYEYAISLEPDSEGGYSAYPSDIIRVFPSPGFSATDDQKQGSGFNVKAYFYNDDILVASTPETGGAYYDGSGNDLNIGDSYPLEPNQELAITFYGFTQITIEVIDWDGVITTDPDTSM